MLLMKKLLRLNDTKLVSPNNDKKIQSIDLIETYPYKTSKDLVSKK